MLFKYKNKIQNLEKDLKFWEKTCNELQETINELKEKNRILKITNDKLNTQIIDMKQLSEENEIMRKYYKADEEPSPEVQSRILADLRLHDMEFKILREKLNDCKQKIYFNQMLAASLPSPMYYPSYPRYY